MSEKENNKVKRNKSLIKIWVVFLTLWFVFSLILMLSVFPLYGLSAQTNLNYTLQSNTIVDYQNQDFDSTANIRNQTSYNVGFFNATFSFTDEPDGSNPDDWTVDESAGTVNVVSEFEGHTDIVEVHDTGAGTPKVYYDFAEDQESGTIEYWFAGTDNSKYFQTRFYEDDYTGTLINRITLLKNVIQYYDGTDWVALQYDALNYAWYHVRLDFECGSGGYMGLGADEMDIYINGVLEADGVSFAVASDNFGALAFMTAYSTYGHYGYFDAVGFSWDDDYSVGLNYYLESSTLSTLEVNAWEFEYNADGSATTPSQADVPFWNEPTGTASLSPQGDGRSVWMKASSTTHDSIAHDFAEFCNVIEAKFHWYFLYWGSTAYTITYDMDIYSYDETLITRLRMTGTTHLSLYYYNGTTYNLLKSNLDTYAPTNLNFDLFILNSTATLTYSTLEWTFGCVNQPKSGLGKVQIDSYSSGSGGACSMYLNDVSIYTDGVSLSEDYGKYSYTSVPYNEWNNAFLEINATGTFSISYNDGYGALTILESQGYSGLERHYIEYLTSYNCSSGTLSFLSSGAFTLTSIYMYQFVYWESDNYYYPSFEWSNTIINSSYFYPYSTSRLGFVLSPNDDNPEYIQMVVDIDNTVSENRSLAFSSNIDGYGYGYCAVNYTDDTSSPLEFPTYASSSNVILPQTKTIGQIYVLITDNDEYNTGISNGYCGNIRLIVFTNIGLTITTTNLLSIIAPLILLIIPTFLLYRRFGKFILIPSFLLMSIVCYATNLLPSWLFFMIVICCGSLLFVQFKRRE